MKLFLTGLAAGFAGFITWFLLSIVLGVHSGVTGKSLSPGALVTLAIPFLLMVGGPFAFWLVIPIYRFFKHERKKETQPGQQS